MLYICLKNLYEKRTFTFFMQSEYRSITVCVTAVGGLKNNQKKKEPSAVNLGM